MSRASQPAAAEAEVAQLVRPSSKRPPSSRAVSARVTSARTSSQRTTSARPPSSTPNDGTVMVEQHAEASQVEMALDVDKIDRLADLSIGAADVKKCVLDFRSV